MGVSYPSSSQRASRWILERIALQMAFSPDLQLVLTMINRAQKERLELHASSVACIATLFERMCEHNKGMWRQHECGTG